MTDSKRQLSKYMAIFAGGTMISRVLGLVRDMVMGWLIPVGARDAFILAFRLPNMLRDLVGEGASNAAFVPVLSESLEKESEGEFRRAASAILSMMLLVLTGLTVLGVVFMPYLFRLIDALEHVTGREGVSPEDVAFMVSLARWTFPYILFIGLAVFAMGPLFIKKHYSTPSWSPALLNVALVACCLGARGWFSDPVYALVLGVWIGGVAQLAVQFLAMRKHAGVSLPSFELRHPAIRSALWLLVPVLIGQATGEVNKLVDTMFAASLGKGSLSALFYANRLVQLPLSVFGIAISSAILPSLSRSAAREDDGEFRDTLLHGLRQSLFLVVPCLAVLVLVPKPVITLLFEWGQFSAEDTARASAALTYYGAGLLAFAWVKVCVSGFYAVKDTKTPVIVSSISMFLNIVLNFLLVRPMGFRGLALATTVSFTVNFVLLYVLLNRRLGALWDREFAIGLGKVLGAVAAMGAILVGARQATQGWDAGPVVISRLVQAAVPLGLGGVTYLAVSWVLGVEELRDFVGLVVRRKRG